LNDIYMPLESLSLYCRLWKTPVKNLGHAGHINIESGFGRWTGGYGLLALLKKKARPLGSPDLATPLRCETFPGAAFNPGEPQ